MFGYDDIPENVVFTNGCFDILHVGHIRSLREARCQGDYLLVGLNSDLSVRRIKGKGRPIIPEEERREMLLAIRWVDHVILFDEDTPYELIKRIKPKILVKGENWGEKEIVGADLVEKVVRTPIINSTTNIINKIKEN